jgi:hypothetical protein
VLREALAWISNDQDTPSNQEWSFNDVIETQAYAKMQLISVTFVSLYQDFQGKPYQKAHNPAKNSDILIMPNYHNNAKRP